MGGVGGEFAGCGCSLQELSLPQVEIRGGGLNNASHLRTAAVAQLELRAAVSERTEANVVACAWTKSPCRFQVKLGNYVLSETQGPTSHTALID